MKNLILAFIVGLLLVGCGEPLEDDEDIVYVILDASPVPYHEVSLTDSISIFKQISGKGILKTPVIAWRSNVVPHYQNYFNASILGICFSEGSESANPGNPVAVILNDVDFDWTKFTKAEQLHILIHELIHCEYEGERRNHQGDINDIMFPIFHPKYDDQQQLRITAGEYKAPPGGTNVISDVNDTGEAQILMNNRNFLPDTEDGEFFYRLIRNNYNKFNNNNITIAGLKEIIPLSQL